MALSSFVFCSYLDPAEMKQKTMCVEWYPGDSLDGEAVSPSSTNEFLLNSPIWAFFHALSSIRRVSHEENTNLTDFDYEIRFYKF